jgi:hypothetical protein
VLLSWHGIFGRQASVGETTALQTGVTGEDSVQSWRSGATGILAELLVASVFFEPAV